MIDIKFFKINAHLEYCTDGEIIGKVAREIMAIGVPDAFEYTTNSLEKKKDINQLLKEKIIKRYYDDIDFEKVKLIWRADPIDRAKIKVSDLYVDDLKLALLNKYI